MTRPSGKDVDRVTMRSTFFSQAEDGIRYWSVTGVQTCALPILWPAVLSVPERLGITSPTGLRIVGALIGAGTVAVLGLLGRRVGNRLGVVKGMMGMAADSLALLVTYRVPAEHAG